MVSNPCFFPHRQKKPASPLFGRCRFWATGSSVLRSFLGRSSGFPPFHDVQLYHNKKHQGTTTLDDLLILGVKLYHNKKHQGTTTSSAYPSSPITLYHNKKHQGTAVEIFSRELDGPEVVSLGKIGYNKLQYCHYGRVWHLIWQRTGTGIAPVDLEYNFLVPSPAAQAAIKNPRK